MSYWIAAIAFLAAFFAVKCWHQYVNPLKWQLKLDEDQLIWGQDSKLQSQVIDRQSVKMIQINRSDGMMTVWFGTIRNASIPNVFLADDPDFEIMKQGFRSYWPTVQIEDA